MLHVPRWHFLLRKGEYLQDINPKYLLDRNNLQKYLDLSNIFAYALQYVMQYVFVFNEELFC